jgi:hypothetical protein
MDVYSKEAQAVAECPHLANLLRLSLDEENHIGDDGARALAESQHLTNLRRLDLNANYIGNVGAQALAASRYLAADAVTIGCQMEKVVYPPTEKGTLNRATIRMTPRMALTRKTRKTCTTKWTTKTMMIGNRRRGTGNGSSACASSQGPSRPPSSPRLRGIHATRLRGRPASARFASSARRRFWSAAGRGRAALVVEVLKAAPRLAQHGSPSSEGGKMIVSLPNPSPGGEVGCIGNSPAWRSDPHLTCWTPFLQSNSISS